MQIEPLGDCAALIRLGDGIDEATHRLVRAAWERLAADPVAGTVDLVPAFTTLALHYDPARTGSGAPYEAVRAALERRLARLEGDRPAAGKLVEIPVVYGGPGGPDLEAVAAHAGLSPAEVVRVHASGDYLVHMVGFAPGFPYLGGMDARIACPRRDTPRTRVPAGSVGIGGRQTGVYPLDSPGGWQIIGCTELRLFDAAAEPPALLRAGDRIRFLATGADRA
jgi:inhibitor of KinA